MENIRRNLRNETEDDLMRMFEEFKKSGSKPSANVKRVGAPVKVSSTNSSSNTNNINDTLENVKEFNSSSNSLSEQKKDVVDLGLSNISSPRTETKQKPKKKSLFAMRQANGNKFKDVSPFTPKIPKGNSILSKDVVENVNSFNSQKFSKKRYYDNGFPEVTIDYSDMKNEIENIEKEEKKEINKKANECTCGLNNCDIHNDHNDSLLASDNIISKADKEAIHKENMSIIGNMSKNEILEIQKELQSKINPETLKWLKERRRKKDTVNGGENTNKADSTSSLNSETQNQTSKNTEISKTKKLLSDLMKTKLASSTSTINSPSSSNKNNDNHLQEENKLDSNKLSFIANNRFNTSSLEDISDMDMLKLAEKEATSQEELEKIEWMKPIDNENQNNNNEGLSVSKLRFDFKGNIIDKNSDISMSKGLHHHGDDPTQAGYTLDEFLYLTRSTVFSQKSICLQALTAIIKNAYTGKYNSTLTNEIINYLMKQKSIINIRMALDDSNETVIVSSISTIAAFLGKTENFEISTKNLLDLQPYHKLSRCNYFKIFCLNPRNINNYSIKISGQDIKKNLQEELLDSAPKENENSIEYHASIASKDIVKCLLKMSILQRLNYLLKYYPLPPSAYDDVIWILSTLALHSEKAANDILNNKNILYQIVDECLSINWPMSIDTENQTNYPIVSALNLIKILCQSSRNNAQYLIDSGILTILIRFILIGPNEVDKELYPISCIIQEYILHIFKIIVDYELYTSSFTDIRESILKYFGSIGTKFLTCDMLISGVEEDMWRMNAHFQLLYSIFNCLLTDNPVTDDYLNFAPETLIQPFLKSIIEFLTELNTQTFESSYSDTDRFLTIQVLISNGLNMITTYIKYMVKKQYNFNNNNIKENISNDQLKNILELSGMDSGKYINIITNDFSVSLCSRLKIFKLIWNKNKLKLIKLFEIKNEKINNNFVNSNEFFEFNYLPGWYHPNQVEYITSCINLSMLSYILQKRIESQIILNINDEAYDDDVMMIIKQILLILVHPEYTSLTWTSIFINNLVDTLVTWTVYADLDWEKEINKLTDLKINEYFQLWYLVLLYVLPKITLSKEIYAEFIIDCLFNKENLKFLFNVEFNNVFINDDKNSSDIILQERKKHFVNSFSNIHLGLLEYTDTIKKNLKELFINKNNEGNMSSFFIRYKAVGKDKKKIEKGLPLPINWVFKLIDGALKTYNTPKELISNIKSILFYIFITSKNISLQQVLLNSPVCLKHSLKDQVISSFGMTNDWMILELMKIYLITCEGSGDTIEQDETYEIFNDIDISRILIELYCIILKYDRYRNNFMMKSRIVKTLFKRLEQNVIIQSAYCPFNNQSAVSLYKNLIEQFKSSSFGDKVFICYVAYPLQGRYLNDFKELFWNEVQEDFSRLFPMNISSLNNYNDETINQKMNEINNIISDLLTPQINHIELFRNTFISWLKPYESKLNILQCMFKCVLSTINYELSIKSEINEITETVTVVNDFLTEKRIDNNFSILNRYTTKYCWIYWVALGHIAQFIYSKFNKNKINHSINTSTPLTSTTPKVNKEIASANAVDDIKKDILTKEEMEQFYNNISSIDKDFLRCIFLSIKFAHYDKSENEKETSLINNILKLNIAHGGLFESLLKDVNSMNYYNKNQIYDYLYQNL